ncbi:3alpha(or 20beta)-hydroxysteroid dehydrogenase [Haloactinospora alba]|uniref:3alpha(Or 20beta)-hydroxysteroid dehydrogenase n=1 Tax=Haloactinospora alba TaxID=405555 RepID=A0A543N9G8_9ACTN|nr:glucose 1-dehydrogenase [Haloactinospora alba]TQN28483.1 3alpha(or 20beta)-hydroxysteroid dehydrogenase [Haloactinospora alba]
MPSLDGKTVIITGGARGMGAATARSCVAAGARVLITDVLEGDGRATAEQLGDAARFVRHDVTSEDDWAAVVAAAHDTFGRVDGLVNNAGVAMGITIEDTELAEFERTLRINLTGTFLGMRAVLASLRKVGGGAVVNVSSAAGLTAVPYTSGYGASKWGVRGLTKVAALEFAADGIRVNSVHPGMVATPMTEESGAVTSDRGFPSAAAGRVGVPPEVAEANTFLLSEAATYITGAELAVDGGWSAGDAAMLRGGGPDGT